MSSDTSSKATHTNIVLPRNSCLFAQHVYKELTSVSSPWLSESDREELKEAQKMYWSDDYDGNQFSEPGVHPYEPTEEQDDVRYKLYRSICAILVPNGPPVFEHITSYGTLPGTPQAHRDKVEGIMATIRQKIAERNVQALAATIMEKAPPMIFSGKSHMMFRYLLERCISGKYPIRETHPELSQNDDMTYRAIVFRWHYSMLVDDLVVRLGLPQPGRTSSALWNGEGPQNVDYATCERFRAEQYRYSRMLYKAGCFLESTMY